MKKYNILFIVMVMFSACFPTQAQQPNADKQRMNISLKDGSDISLIKMNIYGNEQHNLYNYMPVNFRISGDNEEKYTLMFFDENDDKITDGAIMHLVLTWGLTATQQQEAEEQLQQHRDSTAFIMGSVQLTKAADDFEISNDTELGKILNESLTRSSTVPTIPGNKMAMSFSINQANAEKLKALIQDEKELRNTFFYFRFNPSPTNTHNINQHQLNYKISIQQLFKEW